MRGLVLKLAFLLLTATAFGQSPHGAAMKTNCASCHTPEGWEISQKTWEARGHHPSVSKTTGWVAIEDTLIFNHDKRTDFPLTGQHATADCRACHTSLVFENASPNCVDCHTDLHQMTVGNDCARCHTTGNWLVDNITDLHFQNGFPLIGVHAGAACVDCHKSESALRFDRIGNDCMNCHLQDFNATTNPDHKGAGFSTNCLECHSLTDPDWGTDKVVHDFFPLTKGHEVNECAKCHIGGNFNSTPTDCFACHKTDFETSVNPSHVAANFGTNCIECHTTDPDWMPANFVGHDDQFFPIYSGKHKNEWSQCVECHQNPADFGEFTCTTCHANPETDNQHPGVNGYVYNSPACLACHPKGDADSPFDHNSTDFPLNGAHQTAQCIDCHANGFAGTPTDCAACHTTDFNQTTNPNHAASGFPTDCNLCHTDVAWVPSGFDHNTIWPLTGVHSAVGCNDCHNGNFTNTPNTCAGCHTTDFQQTTNPNHPNLNLPTDCASCHTTAGWEPATFAIHNSFFSLNGAHAAIATDCATCHNGDYNNTPNTCAGCHTTDFNQTTSPNHAASQFPMDCKLCHSENAWVPSGFDHNAIWPLTGAHSAVGCNDCHNGNFTNTPNTCAGCHTPDFQQTTNPSHPNLNLTTDCASCHTTAGWEPATFAIHSNFYPLNGAHAAIAMDCATCHNGNYNNTPNTCAGCHTPDFQQTTNPNHAAAEFPTDCKLCHSENAWVPSGFDHNAIWPLTGAHSAVGCNDCHNGNFTNTPNTCAGCHTPDFQQTANPNHPNLNLPTDCASCHSTAGWEPATFAIHSNFYPLNGAHAAIATDCATCHNGNYNNTPNTCAGCHTPDFQQTTNPNHAAAQFPTDCVTCHSENAWAPSTLDHNSFFPLTGAHAAVDCNTCHQGNYATTPNTCAGCHTPDFQQTTNPNHQQLNLPMDCDDCHTTAGWEPAGFPLHNNFYPLNGAHAAIATDCATCHNGNYNNTPNTCAGCHTTDYNQSTNPNHAAAQFPTSCADCHGEANWVPANFDHDAQFFPIYSGKHAGEWTQCIDCHTNPANYLEVTCTNCHLNPQTDNEHPGVNGYVYASPACLACHPTGDADLVFDHNSTGFPLTGAHLSAQCMECHSAGFAGTPTDCAACHTADFNQSTNPNHPALNLPTDCASCHTTAGWEPATFAIHNNFYPLNGAHAAIAMDCATCHNGNYYNTPNTCAGCHTTDFNQTTSPNHAAAQFPTDCASCHSETAWTPWTVDHNNFFPLTGAHAAVDCNGCHQGNYTNPPNTCAGCHTADFNQTTNPNHVALNLPMDCDDCHSVVDWSPATFAIHNNFYPLNGAHAAIATDCATCHNGNYNNTPNTCAGCHTDDYNQTTNPNHAAAQFPNTCADCHGEAVWVPAIFDHDGQYFPIYSGKHEGEWSQCVDCHANPANYGEITCTNCHTNPQTDNEHASVNGYVYSSPACLACHPTGDADMIFDHNSTGFPLTGAHLAAQCLDCHANGFTGTPTDCAACHTTDFNQSINPNHVALNLPMDCATCHTTGAGWAPATFAIHNNYYPLNGAHAAISNDCAACHNGNYNNTPNTCAGCHTDDFNGTTNPNHVAFGFPTDCALCHTETAWVPSNFNHDFYPLTGAHSTVGCNDCHNGNYTNPPNTCAGCHTPDYTGGTNPSHTALNLPTDCDDCHTTAAGWAPATFAIHNQFYPLNGAHAAISNDCAACHNGNYNNTPNTCAGCHTDDFNGTTNPNHVTAQFPTDCALCHSETAWVPSNFNHDFYPLTGAHSTVGCNDCHNGNYTNPPNTCAGCHTPDYTGSTNPSHTALNLPTDCDDCHTTAAGWAPATFAIHNQFYPLNGAHAAISNDCAACHNGNYNNTPNTCAGCHTDDFNGTTNPNHVTAQFPTDCALCHTETAWVPSNFNHDFYPLTGAHSTVGCNDCHNGNYNNPPNTCAGCHTPDYTGSTNPSHTALNLPTDCDDCHTTAAGWAPATFAIHNQFYPLNGAHAAISNDCAACHNGNYNNTPNTCAGCHLPDFNGTTNPNHIAAQFPTTCTDCHGEVAWVPSTLDHNSFYPLTGAHAAADCNDCHNGNYNNPPNTCAGCHTPDYTGSSNPSHVALNLSTNCIDCHTTNPDWEPATFAIHNQFWPLNGAHAAISNDCAACHNGNYNNTPTTCVGCHLTDFNGTTNPNHVTAGFPTTCATCHSESAWIPSTFDHDAIYPLNGAHNNIACNDCHFGNYNDPPPNTCVGCHLSDYNGTNDPPHQSAGFPTTCATCHSENAWTPSTFDHDDMYFPIYSGQHEDEWNTCSECHNVPGNYSQFNCLGCHTNPQTNNDHNGVTGYMYNSPACYACHPDGSN